MPEALFYIATFFGVGNALFLFLLHEREREIDFNKLLNTWKDLTRLLTP